jgi:phosphoserine phosphatase
MTSRREEEPAPLLPTGLDATIVLLRHGESQWITEGRFQGQGDSPLSALGRRQAALAADRLAHPHRPPALPIPAGPPVAIHHSPLGRTTETAAVIVEAMAAPDGFGAAPATVPDPGLLEIGQGEWEGLPSASIVERWGAILDGWRHDPLRAWAPGGESLPEVDRRVRSALGTVFDELAGVPSSRRRESHVLGYADAVGDQPWSLLVGHDGVFKVTLLALLELPLARFWTFPFALCGITVVEVRGGRSRLRAHNATDHLASLEDQAAREREAARRATGAL